jgi:OST-HTH/LOTUS domain-containing protein
MQVFGFGENKTPEPFINACSQFIYTENLIEADSKETKPKEILKEDRVKAVQKNKKLIKMLENAIEKTSDDSGWSYVGRVGTYLSNNSSFSTVNYGYQKLGELLKAVPSFEIKMEKLAMYVKIKDS